jgi:hypothetical protein
MQQIIMCDGFYSDPHQMNTLFSSLEYSKNENFIQGQICPMNFANEDMLRQMEYYTNVPENSYEFVQNSGTFVINTQQDLPLQSVCTNFPDLMTQWVGIVCLSKSEQPHFLKFYKNNKTGWDEVPNNQAEFQKYNINSYQDFENFIQSENQDWENKWQETTRIEFGFNKLILFRPGMFHSYSDVYGDTKETGRLLQFFFLKPKVVQEQQ